MDARSAAAPTDSPRVPPHRKVAGLLNTQNADGSWGRTGADQQRSPRASSLVALFCIATREEVQAADQRLLQALHRFVGFLAVSGKGDYGVESILNTSGFVGLALLDLLGFGSTFGPVNTRTS